MNADLASLFGPGVIVELDDPRLALDDLREEERAAVERAVPKRRYELAAGRRAARRAIERLGMSVAPIPCHEDRSPCWPAGVIGSISHTDTLCVAAVASARTHRSVGVDLEPAAALDESLWPSVFLPSELERLDASPAGERGLVARLLFSAKECAYKLQYPLTRTLLEFEDFEVRVVGEGRFEASLRRAVPGFAPGTRFSGRSRVVDGDVWTAMELRV